MKILLHSGHLRLIEKSGVGRAIRHQAAALDTVGIPYTTDPKEDWNIVHSNTVFPSSLRLVKKARRMGKRAVFHAHSTEEDFRNSFLLSNLLAPLFRRWLVHCYTSADLIVTPTPYAKRLLEGYGITLPIEAVSNGIDTGFFCRDKGDADRFRTTYGFSKQDTVVLCVGLFLKRKGLLDFVEMARRFPQYRFIWFGHTNLHTVPRDIRKAVRHAPDNLLFPGYVSREQLRDAYAGCNLFFFPSFEETEGIVVLEALSMCTPVLLRDIPVYGGWLKDGESVRMGRNVEEFSNLLPAMLAGTLPDLTKAGRAVAETRSLHAVGTALAALYRRLE